MVPRPMRRRKQSLSAPPDAWVTNVLNLKHRNAAPEEFARELPGCPVRQETLAGEVRTPAFVRLATKAAAVATAAVATAPEAPGAVRPVLTSARTITRTGYQATKVTGGSWLEDPAGRRPPRRGRRRAGHPANDRRRADRHHHRPGRAVPDRARCLGHPSWCTRCPHRHHRSGAPGAAHAALGAHPSCGATGQNSTSGLVPSRRLALAALLVVGRAGHSRRHHPARRAAQPDPPPSAAAQPRQTTASRRAR